MLKTGKHCQNAKNGDFCSAPKGSRGSVRPRMASRFEPHMRNFEKSQNPQFHKSGQISRESTSFAYFSYRKLTDQVGSGSFDHRSLALLRTNLPQGCSPIRTNRRPGIPVQRYWFCGSLIQENINSLLRSSVTAFNRNVFGVAEGVGYHRYAATRHCFLNSQPSSAADPGVQNELGEPASLISLALGSTVALVDSEELESVGVSVGWT